MNRDFEPKTSQARCCENPVKGITASKKNAPSPGKLPLRSALSPIAPIFLVYLKLKICYIAEVPDIYVKPNSLGLFIIFSKPRGCSGDCELKVQLKATPALVLRSAARQKD